MNTWLSMPPEDYSIKFFVSKYQLYLPDKKLLEQKIKEIIEGE
jgi:hypothetical protein